MCVCVWMHLSLHAHWNSCIICVESEDNLQELGLSFCYTVSGDKSQVCQGWWQYHLPSHLASPKGNILYKNECFARRLVVHVLSGRLKFLGLRNGSGHRECMWVVYGHWEHMRGHVGFSRSTSGTRRYLGKSLESLNEAFSGLLSYPSHFEKQTTEAMCVCVFW